MNYDVAIVGGGIAGLTSAAYLSDKGYKVVLCEAQNMVGGLVNSFNYNGFIFDSGIRAIENSGIVFPMLKQLGIDIGFSKNTVSIVVENEKIQIKSKESLEEYKTFLCNLFPNNCEDIENIILDIKKIMGYMDVLYGIDNPLFVDLKNNMEYVTKTILPWLIKYLLTIKKIEKLNMPIDEYLKKFTKNQSLIDIISQHFFDKTPAFFALSYFSLYLDYHYPTGGIGVLTDKILEFIINKGVDVKTNCKINSIDINNNIIQNEDGEVFNYKKLIWTADSKSLYNKIQIDTIKNKKVLENTLKRRELIDGKIGNNSILTIYMTLNLNVSELKKLMSEHVFFTPKKNGLSNSKYVDLKKEVLLNNGYTNDKNKLFLWINAYLETTTYEISCPAMRDETLAPDGQVGLIISTLFEYDMTKHLKNIGIYKEFKDMVQEKVRQIIFTSIFKGYGSCVIETFVSTPMTIEKFTDNTQGAITGWAFTNKQMPSVSSMTSIARSVLTPLPNIYQAGQWTFSPSGLPISILTGKLAADKIIMKRGKAL